MSHIIVLIFDSTKVESTRVLQRAVEGPRSRFHQPDSDALTSSLINNITTSSWHHYLYLKYDITYYHMWSFLIIDFWSSITVWTIWTSISYHPPWQILDSWSFGGLPQKRRRVWIVGCTNHSRKSTLAAKAVHVVFLAISFLLLWWSSNSHSTDNGLLMKKQLVFSAVTTLILDMIPWQLNSQGKFKFPRPLPMKRRTTLLNLMGRTAKTFHYQASCIGQLEHLKTLFGGRKAESPEFPKTCGARKRLLAGMEKVVEMGGDLRDSWFPNRIYFQFCMGNSVIDILMNYFQFCMGNSVIDILMNYFQFCMGNSVIDILMNYFQFCMGNSVIDILMNYFQFCMGNIVIDILMNYFQFCKTYFFMAHSGWSMWPHPASFKDNPAWTCNLAGPNFNGNT